MDGHDQHSASEESDDFVAEVSELRPHADAAGSASTRSLFAPPTRRQRNARLIVVVCAGLLAVVVILGSSPALRTRALALIPGLETTSTATASPVDSLFYLLPNPPGVDISVDAHLIAPLPLPEYGQPLHLAPGIHVFTWRSHLFPFMPLHCRISVPRAKSDTCPLIAPDHLPANLAGLRGSVISMHVSMSALDSTPAVARLPTVIQLALDTLSSTTTVQQGEWYLSSSGGQSAVPVKATQSLRATRSMSLNTDPAYLEPCSVAYPAIPCRFDGQSCWQLCTVANPPPALAAGSAWIAAALVQTTWDYQTLDGRYIARSISETFGIQLAVLRITWDETGWHAIPISGYIPTFDVASDAVCDPARFALWQTPSWSFMLGDPPPGATALFTSDATPTDGCLAVLDQGGSPAVFLERFGVLLTVNDTANNATDNLPQADATERQLADRLIAPLSATISPP